MACRFAVATPMAFPLQFILESLTSYAIMGKDKKKHAKKDQLSSGLLDVAALSVKKFRKVTKQIGKLSTGQKLVGGMALLAAGLTYLASQETPAPTATGTPAANPAGGDREADDEAPAPAAAKSPRKNRKSPKFE